MIKIIILIIFLVLINIILDKTSKNNKLDKNINYLMYYTNKKIMTETEKNFYIELKKITDSLNMSIFPQIDLERLIKVKDNNYSYRNRIKSRSIDFTIVNNNNYNVVCCIELDDKTHNKKSRIKRDEFINELFKNVNINLIRVKVGNYDFDMIKNKIKEVM